MNSTQVLRSVRKTSNTPVIIITKSTDDELMQDAMKLGASEEIIEPFDPVDLILRIDKVLKERNIEPKLRFLSLEKEHITP
jgi:PleD family two-component response regulator